MTNFKYIFWEKFKEQMKLLQPVKAQIAGEPNALNIHLRIQCKQGYLNQD